jgi:uncharacterized protein (TIGR02466 family)
MGFGATVQVNRLTPFVTEIYQQAIGAPTDRLVEEINLRRQGDDGVGRSNVGGYHSTPFLPGRDEPSLTSVVQRATVLVDQIAADLGLGRLRMNGLWINVSETGHRNDWHHHPFTVLSAVYYVAVPDGSGDLRIERPDAQIHYWRRSNGDRPATCQVWRYTPTAGDLLIFPAYLRHDVEENRSDEARISLAMNYSY